MSVEPISSVAAGGAADRWSSPADRAVPKLRLDPRELQASTVPEPTEKTPGPAPVEPDRERAAAPIVAPGRSTRDAASRGADTYL